MGKRKRGTHLGQVVDDEDGAVSREPDRIVVSQIRNKHRRSAEYAKLKQEKKLVKQKRLKARDAAEKRAVELGEAPPLRKVPRTIENTRELDETLAHPDDDELYADDAADEFSGHFNLEHTPKLLITSSSWCSIITIKFIAELLRVIPNCHYYKRGSYELKQIVRYAKNREFTSIIVIHDNRKEPNGMLLISLPDGPTAHFRLSSLVLSKQIKGHGKPTKHLPELILNNFTTRLGHRIGRMLASLFPQDPNFRGRRAVTFHNQRDFIFFRHHRYIFETKDIKDVMSKITTEKCSIKDRDSVKVKKPSKQAVISHLQECGPRFTLKLLSLQHGTFDSKYGEYEWLHKPDMDTSRRRFFL
eukprot:c25856_g3_i3 orf=1159-2232(-)